MCLLSWQSDVLLSFLNLTAKGSDLSILLFDQLIESLDFVGHRLSVVVGFSFESLPSSLSFSKLLSGLIEIAADSFELALKLVESARRESEVLLSASHLIAKSSVLSHQFLDLLLVGVDFLSRLTVFASVVVEFSTESLCLLSWQSDVLLGFLNLTSECSDFDVLLFDDLIEPLDLFCHYRCSIFWFSFELFPGVFCLSESSLCIIIFSTDCFEFALKLVESACRESEVLLSASHLIAKGCILSKKILYSLFICINLFGSLAVFISVVIKLSTESLSLLRWKS